jgi:DegT/DnrJ/EryC1/StrS aminotransferase family
LKPDLLLSIEKFVPPKFARVELDLSSLERHFSRRLRYAANGRSALYRIIAAHPDWTRMLLPTYLCASVLIPLRKARIEPIFYDIHREDLNGNLSSLEQLADKYGVRAALLPSMYGNPADLVQAEELCRRKGIVLIDDAAQSFGASLQDRPVGTFGDAGFFSVSPGKPLAGHMGAFYWQEQAEALGYTQHDLLHYIKWLDFRIRRLNAYSSSRIPGLNFLLEYGTVVLTKLVDLSLDEMAPFESPILGGLLNDAMSGRFEFRQKFFDEFCRIFAGSGCFSVVRSVRGVPSNHKIVLRCVNRETASRLRMHLKRRCIYSSGGYPLLSPGNAQLANAAQIEGCIVELPIESDEGKMAYLFNTVHEFSRV